MGVVHSSWSSLPTTNKTTHYDIMKVLVAIAVVFVAIAALPSTTEACGDENIMTACELVETTMEMKRPSKERAMVIVASVNKIGCALPKWKGDRAAMGQAIANMLRCVMYECNVQEETCVAEDKLTEAKKRVEWFITILPGIMG